MTSKKAARALRDIGREIEEGKPHVHEWNRSQPVMQRMDGTRAKLKLGEQGVPWNGPYECSCGKSLWLKDGRPGKNLTSPDGMMLRMTELRDKLESGQELTDEEKHDLEVIGKALMDMINAFIEAIRPIFEAVAQVLSDFWSNLPDPLKNMLVAYRDMDLNIDPVQTISIVDSAGVPLYDIPITPIPHLAKEAIALQGDVDFMSPGPGPLTNEAIARAAWPNLQGR